MKIYLDTCCYGRPYDDQTEPNTKIETAAVFDVLEICNAAGIIIVGSTAVDYEISKIRDGKLRENIKGFYNGAVDKRVALTAADDGRALSLQADSIGAMDSYHLVAAERAGADFLLTTDAKFLKRTTNKNLSFVNVIDPITFLPEVGKWAQL